MTRRQALVAFFGAVLGNMSLVKAAPGQLLVNLDQWGAIVFTRHGRRVVITVDEIFEALAKERS